MSSRRLHAAALALLLAVQVWLVWSVERLPTEDGPSHRYVAHLHRQLRTDPASPLARFFAPRRNWFYPNALYSLYLTVATGLFSVVTAEKLAVSLYLVGLPLASRFFLVSLGDSAYLPTFLTACLSLNACFFRGFFNFLWGVPLALLFLGVLWRTLERPAAGKLLGSNVLLATVYLAHLVAFALALAAAAVLTAHRGRRGLATGLKAVAPAAVLGLVLWPHSVGGGQPLLYEPDFVHRLPSLITARFDVSFGSNPGSAERLCVAVLAPLVLGLALHGAWRQWRAGDWQLPLLLAGFLALAVTVPIQVGAGGYLNYRFALLFWLVAVMCVRIPGRSLRIAAKLGTAALVLIQVAYLRGVLRDFEASMAEFRSGIAMLPRGAQIFPYVYSDQSVIDPLEHLADDYLLALDSPDFFLWQADRRHADHFPVHYTAEGLRRYPGERPPESIPLDEVAWFADYLLVWGEGEPTAARALAAHRYTSTFHRGRLRILRREGPAVEAPAAPGFLALGPAVR